MTFIATSKRKFKGTNATVAAMTQWNGKSACGSRNDEKRGFQDVFSPAEEGKYTGDINWAARYSHKRETWTSFTKDVQRYVWLNLDRITVCCSPEKYSPDRQPRRNWRVLPTVNM